MHFTNTITIERSAHDVFEYVSNLENLPAWNYAVVETEKISSGPRGVGTRYRQIRSLPRRSEETLRIIEYEPDVRLAVEGDLGPLHGTVGYELVDVDGLTRLTNTADLEGKGILRFVAFLTTGRVRAAVAGNLMVLKELLEFGRPCGGAEPGAE
jgi:hypothetical protein